MPKIKNTATRSRRAAAPKQSQPASPAPGTDLTEIQQLVCNLAADLVLNGGHRTDVKRLLKATLGHSLRLRFPQRDAWIEDGTAIDRDFPDWLQRISRHWPAGKKESTPEQPKTVSEMARANVRGTLRIRFEEFLGDARVHELYLLDNVLSDFDSRNSGPDGDTAESPLAEAFMLALESDHTYIKVSRDHVEAVEEYVARLGSVPDEEDEMAELTRLWRQDHPEPMSGSSARPNGHLGRKDDDDDED